jgi:hypothetical protein
LDTLCAEAVITEVICEEEADAILLRKLGIVRLTAVVGQMRKNNAVYFGVIVHRSQEPEFIN